MNGETLSLFPELTRHSPHNFTTGVLPSQTILELIAAGHIASSAPIDEEQIQPSSIDLRLGPVAYRVRASFPPGRQFDSCAKTLGP